MTNQTPIAVSLILASVVILGCSHTHTGSQMKPINSAHKLTASEWDQFANWMKNSMVQTGVLPQFRQADGGPAVIAIADFDNNTSQEVFDKDKVVMENAIRKTLVNSGQAVINRDVGGSGAKREGLTRDITGLRDSTEYDPSTVPQPGVAPAPSLGLYLQINRIEFSEGLTTQYDYAIHCELIDLQNKHSVWEDQFLLSKQFVQSLFQSPRNRGSTRNTPGADRINQGRIDAALRPIGLTCGEVRLFPSRGGPLEAQIDVVGRGSSVRRFNYRFTWLDDRGNVIRTQASTWKSAVVSSGGGVTVTSVAPTEAASDFRFDVRKAS
jgi:hypothetical protein